ncbi:hypothetical protein Agub_g2419 [Astrephomene gubernaculifera]|uniref:Uncharacterized protein n=1 Tax=Astrephomene gubernaculifera TaxID=47775 RepID=A0AAD3HHN1_9CHLO|nr:hypothetical protein Agub_g2419 [Astrephomene gubernaculifera]
MQRDDELDSLARSSFSFGGGHRSNRGSANMSQDAKTAAQLLKLQKLVESLVVRELERGGGSNPNEASDITPRPDASTRHHQRPQHLHQHHNGSVNTGGADGSGGGAHSSGSRKQPTHRDSSVSSATSSLDDSLASSARGLADAPARAYGSNGAVRHHALAPHAAAAAAAAAMRAPGFRSPGRLYGIGGGGSGPLDEGVHVQVATLQGQLAVLGEQLNSAYRAADGVTSPPRASAAATAAAAAAGMAALRSHAQGQMNGAAAAAAAVGVSGGGLFSEYGATQNYLTASMPQRPASSPPPAGSMTQRNPPQYLTSAAGMTGGSGMTTLTVGDFPGEATFGGGGAGGAGNGGGSGGATQAGAANRMRQLAAEERAVREASVREDERLRNWIQDLRTERRRLEDRLLDGDGSGVAAQQLRDDLEKQVLGLSRQRDQLAAELHELAVNKAANAQLAGQVEALEAALATEVERVARYKEVRPALEARLADVSGSLESLRQQHAAALEVLAQERDAALQKAKRASKRCSELELSLEGANADIRRLHEEIRSQAASLAEARASGEVMQATNQQMQTNMEAQARETATRLATVQAQLESSQSECAILRRQLEAAQQAAAGLREQLQEATSRVDALSQEREQLSCSVAEEQRGVAAARQQAESLGAQLKASEETRAEAARAASAQLEALRRQHALDLAATQKQYESQLAAAEKQYLLLQRQYDAGLASSDKAAEAAVALRRERDALWADTENLRAELDEVRKEKADVSAKLTALRTEVRATMEEVARDRDARVAAASGQTELLVREARAEADRRVAAVQQEYDNKLTGLREVSEKLRCEASEAQRQLDKYRHAIGRLKDQVRDLLLSRDAAERELAAEKAFNEELNRIVTAIRSEQQQQQQAGGLRAAGSGTGTGSGTGSALGIGLALGLGTRGLGSSHTPGR